MKGEGKTESRHNNGKGAPASPKARGKKAAVSSAPPALSKRALTKSEGSLLGDSDLYLFNEGTHSRLYEKMGAHVATVQGKVGTHFAVWAPNAERVTAIGDFNGWDKDRTPLTPRGSSGIWAGWIPGVEAGMRYKYHIVSGHGHYRVDKADPFGFWHETPPLTASVVTDLAFEWHDSEWMQSRAPKNSLDGPMSIYEVHLGSWMRMPEEGHRSLGYREIAPKLAEYVNEMGYTHVEFLPLMEHPFYGSWGYQVSGYVAPTSRYGTPQDLMYLIDYLHRHGIGVILDWVPAHFPSDEHALGYFDGTHLFEHADPKRGFHPDWQSLIFNYGRHEVRSFLLSTATFWLDKYHIDGLRVDGVASMLYLDYSREEGDWIPNEYGGRENIEAISFLRQFNTTVYEQFPDTQTMAEESTAWPMVSRPTYVGGLGFGLKWDMGWMHDTLKYMSTDPLYRHYHQGELTFRMIYAFHENFVLPLSHDEVVHGKGSLLAKMSGNDWEKFANLRLLYTYMYAQPGKKLLFMGGEFGQWWEWDHDSSLQWHLTQFDRHKGVQSLVKELNRVYRAEPALYELDADPRGFEWIDASDADNSVVAFLRKGRGAEGWVLAVLNFTPVPRFNYRLGVPTSGFWRELVNSDAKEFWGSGHGNLGGVEASPIPWHGRFHSVNLTLPPLGGLLLKAEG